MTHQEISSMTEAFLANGGAVKTCPTRIALGSKQLDMRPLLAERFRKNVRQDVKDSVAGLELKAA